MIRHTHAKSQSRQEPQMAGHAWGGQQPQAGGDSSLHHPQLHDQTEQPGPPSGSSSSSHEPGRIFNAPRGIRNINEGSGNQFPWANFQGPVYFGQSLSPHLGAGGPQQDSARREKEIEILKCLNASPYRDRKDRNPDRVPGTCDWFVSHELFRNWQESKSSRMLWVSADPGCGKSVLAKYLVDSVLPTTKSRMVCYFFFKDDFKDQRNVVSALCCILHQLFTQKRTLLSDAILDQFDIAGEKFTSSFDELWQALISAAKTENAGEIICLLDAIDECEDQGRSKLTKELRRLYSTGGNLNLKFLLTSRPYDGIRRGFEEIPMIHLSGESEAEMEKISREIDVFITAKVQDLGARLQLAYNEQTLLLEQLKRIDNRTYLWVHLTLDLIENDIAIAKTRIVEATHQLPKTVDEAYNRILLKSPDPEEAKKILHIVVAAARPLTLKEMNLALALKESHRSYNDIDLRPEDRFPRDVRDICGLFVTIINSRIYLLHQTAKEFLVRPDRMNSPKGVHRDLEWKYSLRPRESHHILTKICIWHLLLIEFETHPLNEIEPLSQYLEDHIFLDYSAKYWAAHLRELPIKMQNAMTQSILRICDTSSKRFQTWFRIYWISTNTDFPARFTTLMAASYFGLETAIKRLLKTDGIDLNSRDATHQRSALSWAAGNGFDVAVKALIKIAAIGPKYFKLPFREGAKVDLTDKYGRTPLSYAVWNGNAAVIEMLIRAGARVDFKDKIGGTPLSYAVCSGQEEIIKLLLKKGSQVGPEDVIIKELMFSAAQKGDKGIVKLLLDTGRVDPQTKDSDGRTPLLYAAERGDEAIVGVLLEKGADPNSKDNDGQTPLQYAAEKGDEAIIKLLLEKGADPNSKDNDGRTPLLYAAEKNDEVMVKLLIEKGTDINITEVIAAATRSRSATVMNLLLEQREDIWMTEDIVKTAADNWESGKKIPPGLEALYDRTMRQRNGSEDELYKQVLAIMATAYQPLTFAELALFVELPNGISDGLELLERVVQRSSFLIIRAGTICFIHESTKDYLRGKAGSAIFLSGPIDVHRTIFLKSLEALSKTLRRNIYGLHHLGLLTGEIKRPEPDPLAVVRYPCTHWARHFCDVYSGRSQYQIDYEAISRFLRKYFLYWLEALGLIQHIGDGVLSIIRLENLLKEKSSNHQFLEFTLDLRRFIQKNSWVIANSPLQVYTSALLFSPLNSLTRRTFKEEVPQWLRTKPIIERDWSPFLQTLKGHTSSVSSIAFSTDGSYLASGSGDDTIKIWDMTTGEEKQTLKGHTAWVSSVAFSADGRYLASGSYDDTIKIWDATTGEEKQTLNIGTSIKTVSFDDTASYLHTEIGPIKLGTETRPRVQFTQALSPDSDPAQAQDQDQHKPLVAKDAQVAKHHGYGLSADKRWITWNEHNILWLPPEYQPSASAFSSTPAMPSMDVVIALGCPSGRVAVIGMSSLGPCSAL